MTTFVIAAIPAIFASGVCLSVYLRAKKWIEWTG